MDIKGTSPALIQGPRLESRQKRWDSEARPPRSATWTLWDWQAVTVWTWRRFCDISRDISALSKHRKVGNTIVLISADFHVPEKQHDQNIQNPAATTQEPNWTIVGWAVDEAWLRLLSTHKSKTNRYDIYMTYYCMSCLFHVSCMRIIGQRQLNHNHANELISTYINSTGINSTPAMKSLGSEVQTLREGHLGSWFPKLLMNESNDRISQIHPDE